MKHIKNQSKKNNKDTIKKGVTTLILLFFVMVMVFQKDTPNTEFQFVRNSNENNIHGGANDNAPASQRDYLFQNEAGNDVYQGQMTDGQRRDQVTPPSTEKNMDGLNSTSGNTQISSNIGTQTGQVYTGVLGSGIIYATGSIHSGTIETGVQAIETTGTTNTTKIVSDCITPWKEKIKNKDFVLAYEQRKDVNNMCNIEKRVCTNGILGGSFTQSSCKEDIVYIYRKAEVVSYNQKVLNEYIQPAKPANAEAEFNNEGKIDTIEKATSDRGTGKEPVITSAGIRQNTLPSKTSCTTPRGQEINHGQFVKAYKAPRGFIDLTCDVEIRPCIEGNLKGTFTYSKCTFNNTSYIDYMNAGGTKSNTKFFLFERIKGLR